MRVELIETIKTIGAATAEPIRVKMWEYEIAPWEEINPEIVADRISKQIANAKASNHAPVSLSFDVLMFVNGTGHFADPNGSLAAQLASWSLFDYSQYDHIVRSYEAGKIKAANRSEGRFIVRPREAC